MDDIFKTLTKYSKNIFLVGLSLGLTSAYLERVDYHPAMVYITDFCLILCALGITFWPRK